MKKLLIFLLLAQSVFAQTLPPRTVESQSTKGYPDLKTMFEVEGKRNGWTLFTSTATTSATVVAGTAATVVGNSVVPGEVKYKVAVNLAFTSIAKGKAGWVLGGHISCTKKARGTFFVDNNLLNTNYPAYSYDNGTWECTPNGRFEIPGGGVVRFASQFVNASLVEISEPWSSTLAPVVSSTATVEYGISADMHWLECFDDLNYAAPYVIGVDGDSKLLGTGVSAMNLMPIVLLRNYYAAKGYDVRVRDTSVFGSTSYQHEYALTSGKYNFPVKAVAIFLDYTTNDAITSTNPDSTAARVKRQAIYHQKVNPGAFVGVLAPAPMYNATNEANAAAIWTKVVAAINGIGNSSIVTIPQTRTAWTPTNASYYVSTSDGVHWADLGHATFWSTWKAFLDSNLPALPKPAIR